MLAGGAARLLSSAVAFLSLPLAVRYLGAERYGVWATVTSVSVWLNLLDLGIANSLTNAIARAYAGGDRERAGRAFSNALAVTSATALMAWCGLVLASRWANWSGLFHAQASLAGEIRWTAFAAITMMMLNLPANLTGKALAGYQELHRWNHTLGLGALLSLLGLAGGVWRQVSMPLLFVLTGGGTTLAAYCTLLWLLVCHKPWLRPRLTLLRWSSAAALFDSGWPFLLIQIAAVVVFSSDNLIVSHYLGAAQVTPYSVTWRLVGMGAVLPSLAFPALWPAYAEAHARGHGGWIRRTYFLARNATLALNAMFAVAVAVFGQTLIRWWAGRAAVPERSLLLAMAAWSVIYGTTTVQSCLLAALNRTRLQAVLSIAAAALNIVLSLALVTRIGSLGVILGTMVSYLLVLIAPQTLIVHRAWQAIAAPGRSSASPRLSQSSECAS
jgi:O-antigen/teichoic acid export membrane protein